MSESRRMGKEWTEEELTVVLDMYVNENLTDSHGHDEIARCMGRYNPTARSNKDGAINEKLAEIKGHKEATRRQRHPGNTLLSLMEKYDGKPAELRAAAIDAWKRILRGYEGAPPPYVRELL